MSPPFSVQVHLGISFAVPVGLPRASRVTVAFPADDAHVISLRTDPDHPHVLGGESEFDARVVAGGVELVQVGGGCDALRCVPTPSILYPEP